MTKTKKELLKENEIFRCELSALRGITHDLKNPLQAQEGFCNILSNQINNLEISDEQKINLKENLGIISDISLDTHTTLNDVIDLMAFEEERFRVNNNEKTYLTIPVEKVLKHYKEKTKQYGFDVTKKISPEIEVNVWEHHIKRIMYNIFGNSIKFNQGLAKERKNKGEEPVRIAIGAEDLGEIVEWHIWDNGIGLDPDKTEKIFEEFYRADNHETGTGLGLSISRKIARTYGGNIIAEGSKDPEKHYSDFIIILPKPKLY